MSSETTEQRAREPCDACGLPYYVDENDSCPYCGETHEEQSQPREATAETEPTAEPTPEATAEATAEPETEPEPSRTRTDRSLLDRITATVRNVIRK